MNTQALANTNYKRRRANRLPGRYCPVCGKKVLVVFYYTNKQGGKIREPLHTWCLRKYYDTWERELGKHGGPLPPVAGTIWIPPKHDPGTPIYEYFRRRCCAYKHRVIVDGKQKDKLLIFYLDDAFPHMREMYNVKKFWRLAWEVGEVEA